MLNVIKGGRKQTEQKQKKKREILKRSYFRMFRNGIMFGTKDDVNSTVFCGVKYFGFINAKELDEEELEILFQSNMVLERIMSLMTYREFITTFPITKEYDGEKYQMKDYFSVMEYLKQFNLDQVIGTDIDELLMEYYNSDILRYQVQKWMLVDRLKRMNGEKSMMEEFADMYKIPTYTMYQDIPLIHNNMTGEWIKIDKRPVIPKGVSVIK